MNWKNLERAVDKMQRKAWGETVRLSFLLKAGGAADPAKPQWEGRAILHAGGDDSYSPGEGTRTRLAAGEAELVLTRDEYDGPTPKTGDVVRAIERDGQPRWEVKTTSDRYSNLWVLSLIQK